MSKFLSKFFVVTKKSSIPVESLDDGLLLVDSLRLRGYRDAWVQEVRNYERDSERKQAC